MAGSRVLIVSADAEPRAVYSALKARPSRLVHIIGTPREREEAKLLSIILSEQAVSTRTWIVHVDAVEDVFATASQIITQEQEVVICSTGVHQAALLSAAFVHGVPALDTKTGRARELPVLPFDYGTQLASSKLNILEAVRDKPATLSDVIKVTKLKPSAVSYHLHGSSKKPGLISMRVVSQDEKNRLTLTSKGRALVRGLEGNNTSRKRAKNKK